MSTLKIHIGTVADAKARFLEAGECASVGKAIEAASTLNFTSYDDLHRVLSPSRVAIVKALAGQGALSIREIARRVERDVKAVHRDVSTLTSAGVIDRTEKGVEFPFSSIHFEFDVDAQPQGNTKPTAAASGAKRD